MKIYVLTSEHNDYDQHGEYYIKAYVNKPTVEELALQLNLDLEFHSDTIEHILSGGGRRDGDNRDYHVWYHMREEDIV